MAVITTKISESFGSLTIGGLCVVNSMKVYDANQIKVFVDGDENDPAVVNTDYTVSIAVDFSGCTVTTLAPLVARATTVAVARVTPLTSDFDITPNGKINETRLVEQLDRGIMREQENAGDFARALVFPVGDTVNRVLPTVANRASKLLGFTATGEPVAASGTGVAPDSITSLELAPSSVTATEMASGAVEGKLGYWPTASVDTLAALGALSTTRVRAVLLTENGKEGFFAFKTGDFTAKIAADTLKGFFVPALAVLANAGCWVRQANYVAVDWFGAVADGVTNAYAASNAALAVAKLLLLPLVFGAGDYSWNLGGGTADWDMTSVVRGARRAIPIRGSHIGTTSIHITNSTSIGWYVRSSTDWFDLCIEDITVYGATAFPLVVLGNNDFSDPPNMVNCRRFAVENSLDSASNVALRLNYIAGGHMDMCRANSYALAVADVLVAVNGTALECRQASFVKFSSGSYGNADRAVDFKDGFNFVCSFTSSTLENSNYAISNRSGNSGAHAFRECQLTNCLVYEVYSSAALADRYILVENCNYDGTLDVDPANLVGVRIVDRAVLGSPAAPASSTTQFNTSGRDITMFYWGLSTLTSISVNGIADGITATSGSFPVPAGGNYSLNGYTGTPTIRWRNDG